jgi:hypothetical protein
MSGMGRSFLRWSAERNGRGASSCKCVRRWGGVRRGLPSHRPWAPSAGRLGRISGNMPERTNFGEQIGPTTYAEEYGVEAVGVTGDEPGRAMVHVVIHPENARALVNTLRSRLKASC